MVTFDYFTALSNPEQLVAPRICEIMGQSFICVIKNMKKEKENYLYEVLLVELFHQQKFEVKFLGLSEFIHCLLNRNTGKLRQVNQAIIVFGVQSFSDEWV